MRTFLIVSLVFLTACSTGAGRNRTPAASSGGTVMQFIANDYAGALAQARQRKLPLFVEAWAPW